MWAVEHGVPREPAPVGAVYGTGSPFCEDSGKTVYPPAVKLGLLVAPWWEVVFQWSCDHEFPVKPAVCEHYVRIFDKV